MHIFAKYLLYLLVCKIRIYRILSVEIYVSHTVTTAHTTWNGAVFIPENKRQQQKQRTKYPNMKEIKWKRKEKKKLWWMWMEKKSSMAIEWKRFIYTYFQAFEPVVHCFDIKLMACMCIVFVCTCASKVNYVW